MLSTSWEMPGWWVTSQNQDRREKHQQSQICGWYHSNGRKGRGTREPLDEGEGGERKSQLKTKILKKKKLRSWHRPHYCMANRRGKGASSDGFPLPGPQNHCRRWLQPGNQKTTVPGRKAITNLDTVKKQRRDSADKGLYGQATDFPVVTYSCESWTVKKAECQRIEAFELWCWRRLLRVPWTARRSNQSILREINPEYSLEGLMSDANFDHLMQTADSLEKSLMIWKIEGRRRRGHQRVRWLNSITDAMDMNLANFRRW